MVLLLLFSDLRKRQTFRLVYPVCCTIFFVRCLPYQPVAPIHHYPPPLKTKPLLGITRHYTTIFPGSLHSFMSRKIIVDVVQRYFFLLLLAKNE